MSTMKDNLSYTEKYEYAKTIIEHFLDNESKLDKVNEDHVYSDGLLKTLFTTEYFLIPDSHEVEAKIRRNLTVTSDSGQHYLALNRLKTVYTDMTAALGREFMEELTENTIHGLAIAHGNVQAKLLRSNVYRHIRNFIQEYPVVVVFVVGASTYATRLLRARRGTPNSYTVQTTP